MENKNVLYLIIGVLVAINLVTVAYFVGLSRSGAGFGGMGMMGGYGNMMGGMMDEDHWKSHMAEFDTWDEMVNHMEEEHGKGLHMNYDTDGPAAETHNDSHDFGQVSIDSGVVSTVFEIENHGRGVLEIGDISTSCGCTTAEIDKREIGFNEIAHLTVYFDPDFHEEPEGQFTRSVFVETNDEDLPEMQFDIFVEILD